MALNGCLFSQAEADTEGAEEGAKDAVMPGLHDSLLWARALVNLQGRGASQAAESWPLLMTVTVRPDEAGDGFGTTFAERDSPTVITALPACHSAA